MKPDEIRHLVTTPVDAAAYPSGRYVFSNREYLSITYRTHPEAIQAVLPEPLRSPEPLVRVEMIRMPDVTGLGDYTECGQLLRADLDGVEGEFVVAMYVDSHAAIASGREVAAFPKKLAAPRLYTDSDVLVGTLDYGSLRVATATMGYKHRRLDPALAEEQIRTPAYMLKIVRGYEGQIQLCELTRAQITDVTIKGAWTSPARLQLFAHVMAPLADLPVLEVVDATHILTELTLPAPKTVHDYLID